MIMNIKASKIIQAQRISESRKSGFLRSEVKNIFEEGRNASPCGLFTIEDRISVLLDTLDQQTPDPQKITTFVQFLDWASLHMVKGK